MSVFLNSDRPIVTTMIQARTYDEVIKAIKIGLDGNTDAFGLQFERLEGRYKTPELIKNIFKMMGEKPCYITNYRYAENEGKTDKQLAEELLKYHEYGATLIDVMGDLFCENDMQIAKNQDDKKKIAEFVDRLHKNGAEVLISSHTFKAISIDETYEIASTQKEMGADVSKIVNSASNAEELSNAYRISLRLKDDLKIPYLFLITGDLCRVHRRTAPFISNGMFLCAPYYDDISTPAQPLLPDAKQLVRLISKS